MAAKMLGTRDAFIVAAGLALGLAGCGDPPLCASDVFVVIQEPSVVVTGDGSPATPGVQATVRVRTSLAEGERVALDVGPPGGPAAAAGEQAVDADGVATFTMVTLPTPAAAVHALARGRCGEGEDRVEVQVSGAASCDLTVTPAPAAVPYYAPIGVLAAARDPDPATPGLQGALVVATGPGWGVELFLADAAGERSLGAVPATAAGAALWPLALPDGRLAVRAVCRGPAGEVAASATTTFVVDTTPPACELRAPLPGSTITPSYDADGDLANGVQLALGGAVAGADTAGEPATFTITPNGQAPTTVAGTAVDDLGGTTAAATLAPAATPATYELAVAGRDHAGNACASTATYAVVYDGCELHVDAPTAPVTVDADGDPADGAQVDVALSVGEACVGRTVTSDCGANRPSGVVPASGALVLRVDACATSPCEASSICTFRVRTVDGIETSTSAVIAYDDRPPAVAVGVVQPALACGAQATPADDADPSTAGVQVVARVDAPGAATRALEVTAAGATTSLDASADVTVTLAPGRNALVGVAADALGNTARTAACAVTLADLAVSFLPPAADGAVAIRDGAVAAGALTFPLCGTVSRAGATVALAIDGAAPVPATVTGSTFCRTVTLAATPPAHTIVATATAGASFGASTLVLAVDVAAPDPVGGLSAVAVDRQRVRLAWTAPSDGGQRAAGYLVKVSTTALTDANFDVAGVVVPTGLPGAPGAAEALDLFPARTGTAVWVGVATVDEAGNRSVAQIAGPVTPTFDQTGALVAPDPSLGNLALGAALAHGRFDDDDLEDLAVAAPTQGLGALAQAGAVYVYFGGPAGISPTPGLRLDGVAAGGRFGSGLAAVRRAGATRDDLVVGAPGGSGALYVFRGGAGLGAGVRLASTADARIGVSATAPGWFAGGGLGARLAAADFDGDGARDLIASAPTGGGGGGGVVVIYAPALTGAALLSDVDPSGLAGLAVDLIEDPAGGRRQLGSYLAAVGPTQGPGDHTDDLVASYVDDAATAGDTAFVLRGDGAAPAGPGVRRRPFLAGRDLRLDYVTTYKVTEWASQVASLEDQDGDGDRELVIGAYRTLGGAGQVLIVDGGALGVGGVASTADPGVVLTTINGTGQARIGAAILGGDGHAAADVDGDGHEDLLLGGMAGTAARLYAWFGGGIPAGATTLASATYGLPGPSTFAFTRQAPQGPGGAAAWIGDVNGDGLEDACWASPFDNGLDGSFEVLWDAR